jgi:phosphodiesterase/alkaline phosphatase D-like protein
VRADHVLDADWLPGIEQAVESYRRITRGYLGVPDFRRIREQFPTLCIWDDHDIFNNWGSRKTESALDRRMFEAAAQVYGEYQHARNPSTPKSEPPFHYWFHWGDASFIVFDIRGKRDWTAGQLLGEEQWHDVMELLTGPELERTSTLFVVTSIPIAHVARWLVTLFEPIPGKLGDAVRDRWSTGPFRRQRDTILERLFDWQTEREHRQVVVLSGDVHVAGAFSIRPRRRHGVIRQFTSSALTTPLTSYERYLNLFAARGTSLFEPRWRFERHFIRYANNAGLVRLTPREQGGHHVEFLVRGWNLKLQELHTVARFACEPER